MKWLITVRVEKAEGWQQFTVEAANEKEAARKFKSGEGEFVDQEVEVTKIGEPDVEEFGDTDSD